MVRTRIFKASSRLAAVAAMLMAMIASAYGQSQKGTITPVDSDDDAPRQPVLHYYDKHGNKLEEPVLFLADLDTVKTPRPQSPYPLYNGMVIGANFGDALFALIGQKHYSYDISAAVSLHNWFFPVVEAGIGWGEHTADGGAYHFKGKPSFYAKVGINYNILYKSNPDYMAYLGLRFGMSRSSWDITNIRETSDLGKETGKTELLGQHTFSTYGDVVAGLKVKIAGPIAIGWNVRFRLGLHNGKGLPVKPWFVPGYGTGGLTANICAYYTFGQKPRRDAVKSVLGEDEGVLESSGGDVAD